MPQYTFDLNGELYETDRETFRLMQEYNRTGNRYMIAAVFALGTSGGRIRRAGSQIRSSHG